MPARAQVINITEVAPLEFGTLEIPGAGSQFITVSEDRDNTFSGTGTVIFGQPSRGDYRIVRTDNTNNTVSIDITNVNSGTTGLTLDQFTGKYGNQTITSFPQGGLPKPKKGQGTKFYVGARATYTNAVPAGSHVPSFDIVVVYE